MKKVLFFLICISVTPSLLKAQDYIWADTIQYANDRGITAVTHDLEGNIYFASSGISGLTVVSNYCGDIHLRKYTPDGILLWDQFFWGNGRIFDLHVDNTGNLIAGGGYTNSITIDGETFLTGSFISGLFLIKMDADGNVIWKTAEEPTVFNSMINSVTTDASDNIYVAGLGDDITALLRKYDSDGNLLENVPMGIVRTGSDLEVDNAGNIYLSGSAPDNATFDGIHFPPSAIGTGYTNFMVKYNSDFVAQQVFGLQYFTFDFSQALDQTSEHIYFRCTAYQPATFTETDILLSYGTDTGILDTVRMATESFGTFDHPFHSVSDSLFCLLASTSTQNKLLRINESGLGIDSVMIPKLDAEMEHFTNADNAVYFGGTVYDHIDLDTITLEAEAGDFYQPFIAKYAFPEITDSTEVCHALFAFTTDDSLDYVFTDLSTPSTDAELVSWSWDFCDGGTSTSQNTEHIFVLPGSLCACLTILDSDGCTDTYCVSSVGTEDHNKALKIYPNPAIDHRFIIELPVADATIQIFDITGHSIPFQEIKTDSFNREIYLPDAVPGIYLVTIYSGASVYKTNLIIPD